MLLIWAGLSTSKTYDKFKDHADTYVRNFLEKQSPWNYELAKPNLSSAWIEVTTEEQGNKLFNFYNKLGALKSIDSIEWLRCSNQTHTSTGKIERCDYGISAQYERGFAQIYIGLSIENDEIKILQLRVNSDAFME